jgi:hypothetical protein
MKKSRKAIHKVKKAASGKSGRKAKRPAGKAMKIGFVLSTRDHPHHVLAFVQALRDKGWEPKGRNKVSIVWASAHGKYGSAHDAIENLANKHIRHHKVDMIVAAGGLMTAIGVAKLLDKLAPAKLPFVYLIGRSPGASDHDAAALFHSRYKAGGVDQNMPAQYEKSYQQMKSASAGAVTADNVGLIVNGNNAISKPEVDLWLANGHDARFVYRVEGENEKQLSALFQKIRSGPQPAGIVVSCDPYLRSVGPEFDTGLRDPNGGNFSGWVCYPFHEYLDHDPAPSTKSIKSDHTPHLATNDPTYKKSAYYQLGIKAARVLDALKKQKKKLNVGTATWNGSRWVAA